MLKKAGTITAVVAGLLMLGSPAFAVAGEPGCHSTHCGNGHGSLTLWDIQEGGDEHNQTGIVNFGEDSDIASNFNLCQIEVLVIAVPILSHNDDDALCMTNDNDGGSGYSVAGR